MKRALILLTLLAGASALIAQEPDLLARARALDAMGSKGFLALLGL